MDDRVINQKRYLELKLNFIQLKNLNRTNKLKVILIGFFFTFRNEKQLNIYSM